MGVWLTVAAKESLRDFASGVLFFLIVDGEREEIASLWFIGAAGSRENDCLTETDEDRAVGLLGDLPGFNLKVTTFKFKFEYLFHVFLFSLLNYERGNVTTSKT